VPSDRAVSLPQRFPPKFMWKNTRSAALPGSS